MAQEMSGIIDEALECYRVNSSWVSWKCPSPSCQNIVNSNPTDFLWHVYVKHINTGNTELFYETVQGRLAQCNYVPNEDNYSGLYLAKDEDGHDVLCVKSLECLSEGILDTLTRSSMETSSPDPALVNFVRNLSPSNPEEKTHAVVDKLKRIVDILTGNKISTKFSDSVFANFVDQLSSLDAEDSKNIEVLEELWVKLLEMSAVDKREALMTFIATKRWEELKDVIENQIAEPKTSGPKMTTSENETVLIDETKGLEQNFEASGSHHHAYMYGHRALRRRALLSPANEDKVVQKEVIYNPYDNKSLHIKYMEDLSHTLSHLALCSACYFEKENQNQCCSQIMFHFSKEHGGSVKCRICSARFRTVNALAYHMNYCHNTDPQVIDGSD